MTHNRKIIDRIKTVLGIGTLFIALVGGVLLIQREVSNKVVDLRDLPDSVSDAVQVDSVSIDDNSEVELRYYENKSSDKLLIFFHGAGNSDTENPLKASELVNVMAPVYISDSIVPVPLNDEVLYDAVDLAMLEAKKLGFKDNEVSVLGFSMGSAQAVYAATRYPDLHVVIPVAAFTSFKNVCIDLVGASTCTLVPESYLLSETIASEAVASVHQYHSKGDKVVAYSDGQRLFSFLGSKDKEFTEITGGHSDYDIMQIVRENL